MLVFGARSWWICVTLPPSLVCPSPGFARNILLAIPHVLLSCWNLELVLMELFLLLCLVHWIRKRPDKHTEIILQWRSLQKHHGQSLVFSKNTNGKHWSLFSAQTSTLARNQCSYQHACSYYMDVQCSYQQTWQFSFWTLFALGRCSQCTRKIPGWRWLQKEQSFVVESASKSAAT